jgi:hypothetical protein
MRTTFLIVLILLCSCATALKREGQCLETLTPEFLQVQKELAMLEASWRQASYEIPSQADHQARPDSMTTLLQTGLAQHLARTTSLETAHAKLREARQRYQPVLDWYHRVYHRVRLRMEEEQLLSEVFWTLLPGPGIVFYPVVRWNLHSVTWDGVDPDDKSDPIRQFCAVVAIRSVRD